MESGAKLPGGRDLVTSWLVKLYDLAQPRCLLVGVVLSSGLVIGSLATSIEPGRANLGHSRTKLYSR
jgi:hypothetical protein